MVIQDKQKIRVKCEYLLESLIGHRHAEDWWDSPNKNWDGRTPQDVFDGPDAMEVYDYLMNSAYGGEYS